MNLKIVAAAWIAGAMLSTAPPPAAIAQAPQVERIEVVRSGFLTVRRTGKTSEAPGTATGFSVEAADPEFLREPPASTASVGTIFGLRFRPMGEPHGAQTTLHAVWKIPAPGITNPKTGKTHQED